VRLQRDEHLLLLEQSGALAGESHHQRYGGTVDIAVHQADALAPLCGELEGDGAGEVHGERALAHAAFAAGDGDDLLHSCQRRSGAGGGGGRLRGTRRCLRCGDGDLDGDLAHAGLAAQERFDVAAKLLRHLGVGGGDLQGDAGDAVAQLGSAHQAERHNVAAESGILHLLEQGLQFVGSHGGNKCGKPASTALPFAGEMCGVTLVPSVVV